MARIALILAIALAGALPMTASHAQTRPGAEARTRAAIARIEELNPRLNAVIAVDPTAIAQAQELDRQADPEGPLFGMPILIKDNVETAGPLPTTAGSLALAGNVTGRDAPLVARLRQAGAVILGKANLSGMGQYSLVRLDLGLERGRRADPQSLCAQPQSLRLVLGQRGRGGGGMVPAAIGTETDGSITCPAAINGIVGFKPRSAWSAAPMSFRSATARTRRGR